MGLSSIARGAAARLGFKPAPISVGFEITHLCNLACRYCDRHTPGPGEMTREQILGALGELYSLGMRHISLDGGEPLTHRHIDEVAAFLAQRGVRIFMNTNGVLVPRKVATVRLLSKVKISLDGPPHCHDAMRGEGSWQKAINGAIVARHAGVEVELTCVVGRHNAAHIEELVEFADSHRFRIVFQPARSSLLCDGARDGSGFQLEAAEVQRVFARLCQLKLQGSPSIANRWSSLRHFLDFPDDTPLPCSAGWINATLDPQGNLFHCGQIDRSDTSHNVVQLGVQAAFEGLLRRGCTQCWCARVVEENYAWGARFHRMLPPRSMSLPDASPRRKLPVVA